MVWCAWCVCDAYVCVHENVHTYMYMCTIRTCACAERMRAGVCERTRKSESKRNSKRETKSERASERASESERDACSSRLLMRAGSLLNAGLYGRHSRSPYSGVSAPPHAAAEAPARPVEFDRIKTPEGNAARPGDRAPTAEGVGERNPRFPTPTSAIAAPPAVLGLADRRSSPRRLEARRSSPRARESAGSGAAGGCPQV